MATMTATRTAGAMSDRELRESAKRRLEALTARYGADSPQVSAMLARWALLDQARTANDDVAAITAALDDELTAVVDALGLAAHRCDDCGRTYSGPAGAGHACLVAVTR